MDKEYSARLQGCEPVSSSRTQHTGAEHDVNQRTLTKIDARLGRRQLQVSDSQLVDHEHAVLATFASEYKHECRTCRIAQEKIMSKGHWESLGVDVLYAQQPKIARILLFRARQEAEASVGRWPPLKIPVDTKTTSFDTDSASGHRRWMCRERRERLSVSAV